MTAKEVNPYKRILDRFPFPLKWQSFPPRSLRSGVGLVYSPITHCTNFLIQKNASTFGAPTVSYNFPYSHSQEIYHQ